MELTKKSVQGDRLTMLSDVKKSVDAEFAASLSPHIKLFQASQHAMQHDMHALRSESEGCKSTTAREVFEKILKVGTTGIVSASWVCETPPALGKNGLCNDHSLFSLFVETLLLPKMCTMVGDQKTMVKDCAAHFVSCHITR